MLSIKGTRGLQTGRRAGDVNIRVDLPEAGDDRGVHPPKIDPPIIPGECASLPNAWVALPFELELGTWQTTLSGVAKRIEQELEKEPEGASKVARDRERAKRAKHEERAREKRVEDPEQQPDREVIEGTGASSSRDGAGNEPEPRPAESSVGGDQPPRKQSDVADMGDPESDRRRPRETKRLRINVFDGEESGEWVEAEEEWV